MGFPPPLVAGTHSRCERFDGPSQICALSAATGKAFTIVRAGFAFTFISWPKAILTPALVAGLLRVLILQRPGIVKIPVFFTSAVARVTKLSRSSEHAFVFISCFSANVLTMAPFDMALPPDFIDFMLFMLFMDFAIIEEARLVGWSGTA